MSIQEARLQIKRGVEIVLREWGLVVSICLVAVLCFGLGRLSALIENRPQIGLSQAPVAEKPLGPSGMIVAQKGGILYFYPWCSGAQQLLPDQRVWFQSERAAQRAGFAPAKNCRGLGETSEVQ